MTKKILNHSRKCRKAKEYGAELVLGEDYLSKLDGDIIFRSPGTPFYRPELVALREKGVVLTSEMEVFFDLCHVKLLQLQVPTAKPQPQQLSPNF